jgi:hypothetical protein
MRKFVGFVTVFGLLMLFVSSTVLFAADEVPTRDDLQVDAWNQIKPGGDTTCARGTPYSFFVRPGDTDKLMIHFQGGGACWNGFNCAPSTFQTFDDTVTEDEVASYNGVFDFENPQNPVADYTAVVVTYCTADLHTGNRTVEYEGVTIEHQGLANTTAVLDWVYENYPDPSAVFLNGSSAGSYGSLIYAPVIAEHYANARFAFLGDAGLGVLEEGWDGLVGWGTLDLLYTNYPNLGDMTMEDFEITRVYQDVAARFPNSTFAQYTTDQDDVQKAFYGLMGGDMADWSPQAMEKLAALEDVPNFASYTAEGTLHTILSLPELYTMESNGVLFLDWLTALVNGEPVETVTLR